MGNRKKYHTLKNKTKLKSVTGKATIYIYQDFWAQIVVYNMIQDVLHASNEKIIEKAKEQGYKYPIRISENIAIGLLKEELIKIMLESSGKIRGNRLIQLQESIEKYVVPVRKLKS